MKSKRYEKAKSEFDKIITPEVLVEAEELSKKLRHISHEELNREFTI
jgi:hypothetical protein